MEEFSYIVDKINESTFIEEPFRHVNITNFFSEEHFKKIITDKQILRGEFESVEELIFDLIDIGYEPITFPGCIESVKDYIDYINDPSTAFNRKLLSGYGKEIIEGYGLTMRLKKIESSFLLKLIAFFNSNEFKSCILNKFSVSGDVTVETAIQKNLDGYEISPHCDTKIKALTYMINIYTDDRASKEHVHTKLLEFKDERRYLYDFWRYNSDIDTCWVPWDWCSEVKETNINNSIIIFRPSFDTLHAVKLKYDHLVYQRNQIYGNLWYRQKKHKYSGDYKKIDLKSRFIVKNNTYKERLRTIINRIFT